MGAVCRATDKLGREVRSKPSPKPSRRDADRMVRFTPKRKYPANESS
jgi:hypothetical protein